MVAFFIVKDETFDGFFEKNHLPFESLFEAQFVEPLADIVFFGVFVVAVEPADDFVFVIDKVRFDRYTVFVDNGLFDRFPDFGERIAFFGASERKIFDDESSYTGAMFFEVLWNWIIVTLHRLSPLL